MAGDQPLFTAERGKRYRLAKTNTSGDNHPVHLHRHTFELTKVGDRATSGVMNQLTSTPGQAQMQGSNAKGEIDSDLTAERDRLQCDRAVRSPNQNVGAKPRRK